VVVSKVNAATARFCLNLCLVRVKFYINDISSDSPVMYILCKSFFYIYVFVSIIQSVSLGALSFLWLEKVQPHLIFSVTCGSNVGSGDTWIPVRSILSTTKI